MGLEFDLLSKKVIGCALNVHRALGPGLLESVYERCLARELSLAGVSFATQADQSVNYKGLEIGSAYRIDLVVEESLVVELKSVEKLVPLHEAQLLTYMRLADIPIGLLINFNVPRLKEGIKRFVI